MKKYFYLVVIFFLFLNNGFSQDNWQAGYIIGMANDTTFGLININSSKYYSKNCDFRLHELGETKTYNPNNLKGFKLTDGKYFVSKQIPNRDTIQQVFLEFLIHGKIDIYHYNGSVSQYFLEKDGKIYELKNTSEIRVQEGTNYLFEKKEYLGLMNLLMHDAKMNSLIIKSKLDSESLIQVAKKYHEKVCSDVKCIVYEKELKPISIKFGAHLGASFNSFNFGGAVVSDFILSSLVGARMELKNVLIYRENLAFVVDFNVQYFSSYSLKNNSDFSYIRVNNKSLILWNENKYGGSLYLHNVNIDLNILELQIPLVIKFRLNNVSGLKSYIGLGISNSFILGENSNFYYSGYDIGRSLPSYSLGFLGRFGCDYTIRNKYHLYTEFEINYTNSLNVNPEARMSNLLFTLKSGYKF